MPLEFLKKVRNMKNTYNKYLIKLLFIKFIFIVIFINGYSLGEKSLVSYFNDHPNGILSCSVDYDTYDGSCKISYERRNYMIKIIENHEQKTILLHNDGTSQKPIFKVISQKNWPSASKETKLFNQESEILFERKVDNIILYIQYNRGISKYYDNEFNIHIIINFKKNIDLERYENNFTTRSCFFVGGVNEFKREVLGRQDKYPQINTLGEIDTIYWVSSHKLCLPKSLYGCDVKSFLLNKIIIEEFPYYPLPIGLEIVSPYLKFHDSTLGRVKWVYHFVLFYINKEDQKIYILDTFFLDDGVIEFDEWNKRVNGGNNDETDVYICRIEKLTHSS